MINKRHRLFFIAALGLLITGRLAAQQKAVIWKLDNLSSIGGNAPSVLGKPSVITNDGVKAIAFNGVDDGLIINASPTDNWAKFTIEVLFKPDGDGPREPRFVHFEDKDGNRGTFEIRLTPKKQWYLDAFLKDGKRNKGIALIDSTQLHPADRWYWATITYDGKTMISYVNGVKQLESPLNFVGMSGGQIAFGVRINKVSWFKGAISEARFYPEVLAPAALQKVRE